MFQTVVRGKKGAWELPKRDLLRRVSMSYNRYDVHRSTEEEKPAYKLEQHDVGLPQL